MDGFRKAVGIAIRGLNDVLDEGVDLHPLQQQRDCVKDWRQVGLGIMGLHDMFIMLGVGYGSKESLGISRTISNELFNQACQQSALIAKERGTFGKYKKDKVMSSEFFVANATQETIDLVDKYGLRNAQLLAIAPTGSISTMLGISGGIEPIFQVSYNRRTVTLNDGEETLYKVFTPIAQEYMSENEIMKEEDLPKDLFVTAMTLDYNDRIEMQGVWQDAIDASISSTVNVPKEFSVEQVMHLYTKAWERGLKGITVFRDGCRRLGILGVDSTSGDNKISEMSVEDLEFEISKKLSKKMELNPNECPKCEGNFIFTNGCATCTDCGYSPCAL